VDKAAECLQITESMAGALITEQFPQWVHFCDVINS
jgi:hypothetical protein